MRNYKHKMLRKTNFTEDSDQTISEEEEFSPDWPENRIPLGVTAERKGEMITLFLKPEISPFQVLSILKASLHQIAISNEGGIHIQSQLQVLRVQPNKPYISWYLSDNTLDQGQLGRPSEDEVEVPCFQEDEDFTSSPDMASISNINEDIIFKDERFSPNPDEACTWSAINKEAEDLVYLTENARSSSMHLGFSYAKKSHKGGRGKSKPKLLFRFQSHREDASSSLGCNNEVNMSSRVFSLLEELEGANRTSNEIPITEPIIEGEMIKRLGDCEVQPEPIFGHGHTNRSMVDLLDSYQDMNDFQMENKEMQMVDEGSISPVSERGLEYYEEPPEALDSSSSTDDEACNQKNVQNLEIIVPFTEKKTITDKLDDVFGVQTVDQEGPDTASHGTGVFEKLQQVIQNEKKKEMEFFKRMQTGGNSVGETSCIDVEILSRCLEAKLIVCRCSLSQEKEHCPSEEYSHAMNENQRTAMTIMFSTRVCDDVELEVGNLVRIYSPWKEVQVGERDEMVILSTFFSQL